MSKIESQDYEVVEEVLADGDIPITLYANKITGLKVAVAYAESPIVKGDLVFATEAFDDDGLPHTLEHLIFLGSESYPYKGVLDLLANKCFASGTNAYTDTDHTNYTMSTAGSDGFLALLPIYLDHLLFPTLTDAAFITEVHHINGEGEDAGTVYCEVQDQENSGDTRCHLEMLRSMYPGVCGYKSETGGLMNNLRTSTDNIKVRNYHKQFYRAKNLCVVVTGSVEPNDIFKAIKPIEDKIVAKGMQELEFDRPWQTPVEPLDDSCYRKIQYASDTDDDGLVYIGFRGPDIVENYKHYVAISILLDYLNSTAISPIQRDFVECEEAYCSSISHCMIENSTSVFYLSFASVGKQYLDYVTPKLCELLKKIWEKREKFDMERLRTILSRKIVNLLSAAETSPHSICIGPIIGHFLYGNQELKQRCQEIPILEEFSKYDDGFWLDLLYKYMIGPDSRHVSIIGEPSPALMRSMSDAEKQRLAKQKESLADRLPEIAEKLKLSIEANERPVPKNMQTLVNVPSPDSIKFHSIERIVLDESKIPFRFEYDCIKTNFVFMHVLANTSKSLTQHDRLYLPLLSEIIFECPIERDGALIPYEKVIAELFSDTITYDAGIGLSSGSPFSVGSISMLFSFVMQVEISKYERAVKWFHEIMYKTVISPERIKTVATRMINDVSQYKRSGGKVLSSTISGLIHRSNSNQWACNFMRQQKFLKQLLEELKTDPEIVKNNITRVRDALTSPNNLIVHVALNREKMDVNKVHEPWLKLVPQEKLEANISGHIKISDIVLCHELIQPIAQPKAAIVGVGSVESNFLSQNIKSINSLKHPDLAAVHVLLQYLCQLEGPLWRAIRGMGLSYHYSIQLSHSDGLMYLLLYKSAQIVDAYNKCVEIVNCHLRGDDDFEDSLLESAKSSLVFLFIKQEKSAASKSMQSLVAYLRDIDINFNRDMIRRVAQVTKDDMRRVGQLYLKPLFEDENRRTVICCHPSKVDELINGLKVANSNFERITLEEETFLNSIT